MAQQFAEIEITAKTRPCWVNGRRAIFHRWVDSARPAKARGEENDPEAHYFQLHSVHALVEYEDGTMARVWPAVLQFADSGEFDTYDWEGMEEKRDALPFTYSEEVAAASTQAVARNCLTCGYIKPSEADCFNIGHKCTFCMDDECRCKNCEDNSLWIPQGGTNG